jgi:hypothetical protein
MVSTIFLYIDEGPPIPIEWQGLGNLLARQITLAIDETAGNRIVSLDLDRHFRLAVEGPRYPVVHPSQNYLHRIERYSDLALIWLAQHDHPIDILVVGQTPVGRQIMLKLHRLPSGRQPFVKIRFSLYYNGQSPFGRKPIEPQVLGFNLDCPKDYALLWQLLTFQPFIEAVEGRLWPAIEEAVQIFNVGKIQPVIVLGNQD